MTSRLPVAAIAAVLVLAAACGSSPTPTPSGSGAVSPNPSGGSAAPGVLPTIASSEIGVGLNRILVSFYDSTGTKPAGSPDRKVSVAFRGPGGAAIAAQPASFIWAIEGFSGVYILHATFPSAGAWIADFTTSAPASAETTIPFSFDVKARTEVLRGGDPAPPVATPTLAGAGGDVAKVSTDTNPVKRFYETSEADALAAKKPFVLIFATPKFCRTATCGPTLDKLKPIAAAHPEMTFINVEPYLLHDDQGQLQPVLDGGGNFQAVPATVAFHLLSEPYVFVVGADGKISSSFELVFSPEEIEAAIRAVE
ncbi:MAG TPA: hypothetical protein VFY18_14705 [Candidatus Limnocylindrales bacterium]|nr:hypothetical protein [Candidatus Limnocylindrales bacterium]